MSDFGRYVEVRMAEGADPQALLREAAARLRLSRFEIVEPSLHDIFVEQVTGHGEAGRVSCQALGDRHGASTSSACAPRRS